MPKHNFEHIHRRRQADLQALKNKTIKIETKDIKSNDTDKSEIKYNPNIQEIIRTSTEKNSSYSSGSSKRNIRPPAITIS